MNPNQLTNGTILMAKPGKIIIHPSLFVVADKYCKFIKIEKEIEWLDWKIKTFSVRFSQDGEDWNDDKYERPFTWLVENYIIKPYEPIYRNRLEEVDS